MAHFGFICIPTAGHIAPLAAVAHELMRRGHRVTFVHHPEVAAAVEAFELPFHALRTADASGGRRLEIAISRAGRARNVFGLRAMIGDLAESTSFLCEQLPDAVVRLGIDCLVGDWIEPAAGLVARRLRLPLISISAALPLNWVAGDASPYVSWAHHPGRLHRWASVAAQWGAERMQAPVRAVVRAYAERWDLGRGRRLEDWASSLAQISQIVPSLDYPRAWIIDTFHYCGPLRPAHPTVRRSAKRSPGRRRLFASLGSLQGHRADIFESIADAADAMDLDLTIAHGNRLSPAAVRKLSRRATVEAYVDYADILPQIDLAVMHGGLNGVLDALSHGIPLVLIPIAFEQGSIAARVSRVGAGRTCRLRDCRRKLAGIIADVLHDPRYARAAARLGREIAGSGGTPLAADIVEYVARTRAKYCR